MQSSTNSQHYPNTRKAIENAPYMGFDFSRMKSPEDFGLPSAMRAVIQMLDGNDSPLDYFHFLGVSGLAFTSPWHKSSWIFPNEYVIDPDPLKPLKRVMWAAGFEFQLIGNPAAYDIAGLGDRSAYGLPDENGVVVLEVPNGCDAGKLGLRHTDVIVEINGKPVDGVKNLMDRSKTAKIERITIWRGQNKVIIRSSMNTQ